MRAERLLIQYRERLIRTGRWTVLDESNHLETMDAINRVLTAEVKIKQ